MLRTGSQPSTINVRVAAIRSYLKYVADTDISVQSVALAVSQITPCKKIQKEKEILSEQALSAILAAPPCTKTGVRDRAILVLLYDTAARISELLGIRLCDIALDTPYPSIFITGKGNKERTIQLSEQSSSHLREYIRVFHRASAKDDYLFFTTIKGVTGRMSPGNVQRLIKKYAAQARNLGFDIPNLSIHICSAGLVQRICTRKGWLLNWCPLYLDMQERTPQEIIMPSHPWNSSAKPLNLCQPRLVMKNRYGLAVKKRWPGFAG